VVGLHPTLMNMFLAAILGLCALTTPSTAAGAFASFSPLAQESQPQPDAPSAGSQPEPPPSTQPASPAQEPPPATGEGKSEPAPPATPAPDVAQPPQNATPEATAKPPESKTKAATRKRRRRKRAAAAPGAAPEKKVVRNGGTADPVVQLAPGMSAEQASSQRQSTTQLLATTDANLKQISTRQLSTSQRDSISQIRKYMEQAKAAEAAGDVQRAHNLASKAVLLSDDLVKH
jgi:hypothetical protein